MLLPTKSKGKKKYLAMLFQEDSPEAMRIAACEIVTTDGFCRQRREMGTHLIACLMSSAVEMPVSLPFV